MVIPFVVGFTWDARKAESNLLKHGVSFEEAATVFDDAAAIYVAQEHAGEHRLAVIGYSARSRMLCVVTTERDGEVLRIISARKVQRHERKEYEGRR